MRTIVVIDYDPVWPAVFEELRARAWNAVSDVAVSIEHVGSTAVPGLAAKPIIDISVVVPSLAQVFMAVDRLAKVGYVHRGDLGIEGREAFHSPDGLPAHHLYVCLRDTPALANHLAVRDYLRAHPEVATTYGELKKQLAKRFGNDIDGYIDGKTGFLLAILRAAGFPQDALAAIETANRRN